MGVKQDRPKKYHSIKGPKSDRQTDDINLLNILVRTTPRVVLAVASPMTVASRLPGRLLWMSAAIPQQVHEIVFLFVLCILIFAVISKPGGLLQCLHAFMSFAMSLLILPGASFAMVPARSLGCALSHKLLILLCLLINLFHPINLGKAVMSP
jgi:hypothetical protein